jgi:hypothetical protein
MSDLKAEDEKIVDELGPVLDAIAVKSLTHIKRASDMLYEQLLDGVQDYLCENGRWNIAAKLSQCRLTQQENYRLKQELQELRDLGQFLVYRIDDLEWMEDGYEALSRDWSGHVDPALSRFRTALSPVGGADRS